jgi:beta-glucanase (GH16 family)
MVWWIRWRTGTPADRGTWQAEIGGSGWGNQELQYYTGEPGNAALDGAGNLALVVRRVNPELASRRYGDCGYTSARLISRDRVSFRYGLIQARIKIPRARGIWPAFWMLGRNFHVYSVAWDPGKIAWYVNDELYHAVTPADLNGNPGSLTTISSCW